MWHPTNSSEQVDNSTSWSSVKKAFLHTLPTVLLDRNKLKSLDSQQFDQEEMMKLVGWYFEHPRKGILVKQLQTYLDESLIDQQGKKLLMWLSQYSVSLEQLFSSAILHRKEIKAYKTTRWFVVPTLIEHLWWALRSWGAKDDVSQAFAKSALWFLHHRPITSLNDLEHELHYACQQCNIPYAEIISHVELSFHDIIAFLQKAQATNEEQLEALEPLRAVHLEHALVDRVMRFQKQRDQYEQASLSGNIDQLTDVINQGFLDEEIWFPYRKGMSDWLHTLYATHTRRVQFPWNESQNLHIDIIKREFLWSKTNAQQPNDRDATRPTTSITIDLDTTSNELVPFLLTFVPSKLETNGEITFLRGVEYSFQDNNQTYTGYPTLVSSPLPLWTSSQWYIHIHTSPDGFVGWQNPIKIIAQQDLIHYTAWPTHGLGELTLSDRDILALHDLYLTCLSQQKYEKVRFEKNIQEANERYFQEEIHDRQQASTSSIDSSSIDSIWYEEWDISSSHSLDYSSAHAQTDTDDGSKDRQTKWEKYAFGGYTDRVPQELEATLRKEMWKKYPKHGPYAWIERGKIYYNTKWIKELFDIEIQPNPDREMAETSYLFAYVFNGMTVDDPAIETDNYKKFVAWRGQQKRHEVVHRILWFKNIAQIQVKTIDGVDSILTQEQLCSLAEPEPWTRTAQVTLDGKKYLLHDIEDAIAKALDRKSFSFDDLHKIDLDQLEEYIAHGDERFWDQLDANAGQWAGTTVGKWAHATDADAQNAMNDFEQTAPRTQPTGRERVSDTPPFFVWPNKYVHRKKRVMTWPQAGTDTQEWLKYTYNPSNPKQPYVQAVQPDAVVQDIMKLNNGDYDTATNPWIPRATTQQQNPQPWTQPNQPNTPQNQSQQRRQPQQQTPAQNAEHTDIDFEEEFLKSIEGDVDAKFDEKTALYFRVDDSHLPWYGGTRVKVKIAAIDKDAKKFVLKVVDASEGDLGNQLGREFTLTMDKKWLEWLTKRGEAKRLIEKDSPSKFFSYLTQELSTEDPLIIKAKEKRNPKNIKLENGGLLQKKFYADGSSTREPITYIGNLNTDDFKKSLLYKVRWWSDGVTVSYDNPIWEKHMDFATFIIFLADKKLSPFGDEQVNKAKKEIKKHTDTQRPALSRYSLWAITEWLKKIGPLFKNAFNMEERKKIQAARISYGMAKLFWWGIELEALNALDESIYSIIGKFQSSLGWRDSKDGNDVHAEAVSRRIQSEIFSPWLILDPGMFKLKAAGYLLYSLDKGWHPYFRALNSFAHSGLWVKAILWAQHHETFLEQRARKIDEIKSAGDDAVAADKLVKFELQYIQGVTEQESMVKVFGSQFSKKLEWYKDKFGSGDAIDGIKGAMENKNNFPDFANTFRGTLEKHTPATAMAALELMIEFAGSEEEYSEVYMSIVQIFATGLWTWSFGQAHKDRLKKIGRTAGIPLALMADDINAPYKVVTMLDHIAKQVPGMSTLSSKIGSNAEGISVQNLTKGSAHKKNMKAIQDRWKSGKNGKMIIDAFNYKNWYLVNYEQTAKGETRAIIDEYFEKRVFDSLNDSRFGYSDKMSIAGDAPFYAEWILNISPATFNKVMDSMDRNTWQFREQWAREMWIQFKNIMNAMNAQLSHSDPMAKKFMLKLILKKFDLYFGGKFDTKELKTIKEWLLKWENMYTVADTIKNKFGPTWVFAEEDTYTKDGERITKKKPKKGRSASNPHVDAGLDAMIDLLKTHGDDITPDVLRSAFGGS